MESMDIAVARKLKELVLSPPPSEEEGVGACGALLDIMESGNFIDYKAVAGLLQQAAGVMGSRAHLNVFAGRLAALLERAKSSPHSPPAIPDWPCYRP